MIMMIAIVATSQQRIGDEWDNLGALLLLNGPVEAVVFSIVHVGTLIYASVIYHRHGHAKARELRNTLEQHRYDKFHNGPYGEDGVGTADYQTLNSPTDQHTKGSPTECGGEILRSPVESDGAEVEYERIPSLGWTQELRGEGEVLELATTRSVRSFEREMIVPFFGDQPFWGAMIAKAGAGAHKAILYKRLTVDVLAEGIKQCLSPEAKKTAEKLAQDIAQEGDGAKNAVEAFHRLAMRGEHSMRCSILADHVAVWTLKHSNLRLSALAAEQLIKKKKIKWQDLRLVRHYEWNDFEGPGESFIGAGAALLNSAGGVVKGVGSIPVR
ncbi:hypothetical protein ABVK25_002586 [Lepraria finkii]|uniref:Uncharacterized protein n=1 Tax=Lepraria finkii TaxID=1340010 RepID=A0ABR4BG86_9LECA